MLQDLVVDARLVIACFASYSELAPLLPTKARLRVAKFRDPPPAHVAAVQQYETSLGNPLNLASSDQHIIFSLQKKNLIRNRPSAWSPLVHFRLAHLSSPTTCRPTPLVTDYFRAIEKHCGSKHLFLPLSRAQRAQSNGLAASIAVGFQALVRRSAPRRRSASYARALKLKQRTGTVIRWIHPLLSKIVKSALH